MRTANTEPRTRPTLEWLPINHNTHERYQRIHRGLESSISQRQDVVGAVSEQLSAGLAGDFTFLRLFEQNDRAVARVGAQLEQF